MMFASPHLGLTQKQLPVLKRCKVSRATRDRKGRRRHQLVVMTNKLNVMSFLFLLPVSCLVAGTLSLGVTNPENTTISEVQPTTGPPQTNGIRDDASNTAPTSTERAHSQASQPSGKPYNVKGSETNSTQHQLAGTERSPETSFPETKGSLDLMTPSSTPTNSTYTAATVPTTSHTVDDKRSTSRTTVTPPVTSSTKIQTAAKPLSTQKTHQSTTKVCPTAEAKRENLLGRCLITIAFLAALATIFIMTTIILATKLSGIRYRHRASLLHDTEMVCISTLINDSDHPVPTPRRPKSNGALIPISQDEDGDDLTLNSFLHDTEGVA